MSEDVDELPPLALQSEAWGETELVEQIVDRYFSRKSEGTGFLHSWQVTPLDMKPDEAIASLQKHLHKLGWTASLAEDDPYLLTILELPVGIHPSDSRPKTILAWCVSFGFSIILGSLWVAHQDTDLTWTSNESLKQSLIWFATPILAVLLTTSFLRRRLFTRMGVDIGHFLPAIAPLIFYSKSVMYWPFGLLGIFSQRTMEALSWPDRKSMLISGIFLPLCLMTSGLVLTIVGILMTGNNAPNFASAPGIVSLNPLTQLLLSLAISPEEIAVRSVWIHPLGLAGSALSIFGWILLLPVPQFPGFRVFTALVGDDWMSKQGNEFTLFFLYLAGVVGVLVTSGYTPWLFIGALGVWGVFSEQSQVAAGMIVDEVSVIDSSAALKVGGALFLGLLLMAPGLEPVAGYDDWESGLLLDWEDERVFAIDENYSFTLEMPLVGVLPRDVTVAGWAEPMREDWGITIDCGGGAISLPGKCSLGSVDLLKRGEVKISLRAENSSDGLLPTDLHLLVDEGDGRRIVKIRLSPETVISPATPDWQVSPDFDGLVACANMSGVDDLPSGNFSTSALLWQVSQPEGGVFTAESDATVCLSAPSYARLLLNSDEFGQILPLTFMSDDGVDTTWPLRITNPIARLAIPEGGWNMTGNDETTPDWLQAGSIVAADESIETCLLDSPREPGVEDWVYVWQQENRKEIVIPDVNNDTPMNLDMPLGSIVASCDPASETDPKTANFTAVRAPPLALQKGSEVLWSWPDRPLESGVWEVHNLGNESITLVTHERHILDDSVNGWSEMGSVTILSGESISINLTELRESDSVLQVAWLSLDSESGVENSIRLNFGEWCRVGIDDDPSDGIVDCVEMG